MTPITTPVVGDNGARAAKLVTNFILARLAQHRSSWTASALDSSSKVIPPLFVGIQGPQGSGKSHLVSQLPTCLAPLRTASLSLDELYLPHSQLQSLAFSHPTNRLIQGRGQPGTHDLALGISVLSSLAQINDPSKRCETVHLPTYDKSLHDGQGDRANETIPVQGPIDIVLFEGWCLGFQPLPPSTLTQLYSTTYPDPKAYAQEHLDYETPFFVQHELEDLLWVNERLANNAKSLWEALDCFVQLEPRRMSCIWQWRLEVRSRSNSPSVLIEEKRRRASYHRFLKRPSWTKKKKVPSAETAAQNQANASQHFWTFLSRLEQQEHNMKAKNGGIGMTDDQVRHFIDRQVSFP